MTILGTADNDTINGTAGDDTIDGLEGNDSIQGLAGDDSVLGGDGNDTLLGGNGNDTLRGLDGSDTVIGGDGDDGLGGASGADSFVGGPGFDLVSFSTSPAAVLANLATGSAQDGFGFTDTISGDVEILRGSPFNDTLIGGNPLNDVFEAFQGGDGADSFDGGSGTDRADYRDDPAGIVANLSTGQVVDGFGATDTLLNIESVRGSASADSFIGGTQADLFEGLAGNDTLDGGAGSGDRADYRNDPAPVSVNLGTGQASDGFGGTDTLIEIELARGSDFADTLIGGDGGNTLDGQAGNDTLDGGNGIDRAEYRDDPAGIVADLATGQVIDGFGGTDTLLNIESVRGSDFADSLSGGADDDAFEGRAGGDTINGSAGDDTVDGGSGGDSISGGSGNDSFIGGAGNDSILGGPGEDSAAFTGERADYAISLDAGGFIVTGPDGTDTLAGVELLQFEDQTVGTQPRVSVFGTAIAEGNAGASNLAFTISLSVVAAVAVTVRATTLDQVARAGSDYTETSTVVTIPAGETSATFSVPILGDSTIEIDESFAVVLSNPTGGATFGAGRAAGIIANDDVLPSIGLNGQEVNGDGGDNFLVGGALNDSISGEGGNDTEFGNEASDLLIGGAGNDFIVADFPANFLFGAADFIDAGDGNDNVFAGGGDDTVFGGNGDDLIGGDTGNNLIFGGDGNNALFGFDGADTILGGNDGDIVFGLSGPDIIVTQGGIDLIISGGDFDGPTDADFIDAGDGNTILFAGSGNDTILSGNGDDFMLGESGDEFMISGGGADAVIAGPGNDTIDAGAGNDVIIPEGGDDQITGGAGADLFRYPANIPVDDDTITDFVPGGDKVELGAAFGFATAAAALAAVTQSGADAVLALPNAAGTITLVGVQAAALSAGDFQIV